MISHAATAPAEPAEPATLRWLEFAFFLSGFAALLYQVTWQRTLFAVFGINIESVTVVVTVFMLGLGLGSLAGGRLSRSVLEPLFAFALLELTLGALGLVSLLAIQAMGSFTLAWTQPARTLSMCLLLFIPTSLMGSTLPLLVAHCVRRSGHVGRSVSTLYYVNTFGSAVAALATVLILLPRLGQADTVRLAASINILVGATALLAWRKSERMPAKPARSLAEVAPTPSKVWALAAVVSAVSGFVALSYEILWYRTIALLSWSSPAAFGLLLGFYLLGLGAGAKRVESLLGQADSAGSNRQLRRLAAFVLFSTVLSFLVTPLMAHLAAVVPWTIGFGLICVAAALLGVIFPLLTEYAVPPDVRAGQGVSFIYGANIVGSALGASLTGFVLLEWWSMVGVHRLLLVMGAGAALALLLSTGLVGRERACGLGATLLVPLVLLVPSPWLFDRVYERLTFREQMRADTKFAQLTENRDGVIAVTQKGVVYGGGAYDGSFNVGLMRDTNNIFRVYALGALRARSSKVLVIGFGSGSWTQALTQLPGVEHIKVVEINPGYLPLARSQPATRTVFDDSRVEFVVDDGRRWLTRETGERFDLIVMNTTWHWRAHATNLLSREFMQLLRAHLDSEGIAFFNTTGSLDAIKTSLAVFPHGLRIQSFMAVSDTPVRLDEARWRELLLSVLPQRNLIERMSESQEPLRSLLALPERIDRNDTIYAPVLETEAHLRARMSTAQLITDDNMVSEWKDSLVFPDAPSPDD